MTVENPPGRSEDVRQPMASMWPRSDDRGEPGCPRLGSVDPWGFNVATVECTRGSIAPSTVLLRTNEASMWPRSDDRGEHRHHMNRHVWVVSASMWPRSDDRGERTGPAASGPAEKASMWPRSDD